MAHGSPGRKGAKGRKAREGRKLTEGVSRGGVKSRKYVPYFHDKEGQSLLAVSRKQAFKEKMYARFREKKGRTSKMYQHGAETVSFLIFMQFTCRD